MLTVLLIGVVFTVAAVAAQLTGHDRVKAWLLFVGTLVLCAVSLARLF